MRYIFFRKDLAELKQLENGTIANVNGNYRLETFKPDWLHIMPKGMNIMLIGMHQSLAFIIWWLLNLVIWRRQRRSYEHYLVYDGERLAHYSIVLPRYYRYPFMGDNDIQIGPYWTAEEYRGRGICPFVIRRIVSDYKFHKECAYVLIREDNIKSQRSAIKGGLDFYGYGIRTKGFFGQYLFKTDVGR